MKYGEWLKTWLELYVKFVVKLQTYGYKMLSEILGHKNSKVTLNRYCHSLMIHKSDIMNKLGKILCYFQIST